MKIIYLFIGGEVDYSAEKSEGNKWGILTLL